MKSSATDTIARYKFEDAIQAIYTIPIGHFILFLCFIIIGANPIFTNPRILILLAILVLFWGLKKYYNWQSSKVNLSLIVVYLAIVLTEFLLVGVPVYHVNYSFGTLSKQNILEPVLATVPLFYVCLRFILVFPLISIFIVNLGLKHPEVRDDEPVLDSLSY